MHLGNRADGNCRALGWAQGGKGGKQGRAGERGYWGFGSHSESFTFPSKRTPDCRGCFWGSAPSAAFLDLRRWSEANQSPRVPTGDRRAVPRCLASSTLFSLLGGPSSEQREKRVKHAGE